ncbi:MAG: alpha/beta fold hydrolase [Burkholderiales bacterium]
MRLPGGRTLGWSEYGAPAGQPLFYCHGFPGSRLEAGRLDDDARTRGLRVIAPDRPGYGASAFQPGRRLTDWPADVAALADHLGLKRFAVLGISGGGPYALAIAHALPDRLDGCGIVCGLGPTVPASTRHMGLVARAGFALGRHAPWLVHLLYGKLLGGLLRRYPGQVFSLLNANAHAVDRAAIALPDLHASVLASVREAFRQGGRGAAYDLVLYSNDWGFRLQDIVTRIELWHGESDATVPPAFGRAIAAAVPGCRARFFPDEGHFSLPLNRMDDILESLKGGA